MHVRSMLAIGAALVLAAGCSHGSSSEPTNRLVLRIAYNSNATNTTIVVADQQGFFTKNGLDVKLTPTSFTAKPSHLEPWIEPMKKVGDLPADFSTAASQLVRQ